MEKPTGDKELLTSSAMRLAGMIRSRRVSSREVVEAHIRRIEQVNPVINAVVAKRFEQALKEAHRADEQISKRGQSEPGLLHGVPCTIKESFALNGMPNTGGLVARTGHTADSDATAVARLRAAGAIPLGVTNVSELCMWMESSNRVYGRTNNPYDPACHVGGSSGGEGAIIAAGGSPLGLAADVAGSIRLPAFFSGVFGHKPTACLVPNSGQFPIAVNQAGRYLCTGPITRSAEDLMPLLKIMAGPDGEDPLCRPAQIGDTRCVEAKDLDVFLVTGNAAAKVDAELVSAMRDAADALSARGARVETTTIAGLEDSFYIWSAMMDAAGGPSFAELMGQGRAINAWLELLRWVLGRSEHTLPAIGLAILEKAPALLPGLQEKYLDRAPRLKDELNKKLGPRGVMLYPTFTCTAQRHNLPLLRFFHSGYTSIVNVMELPATQVPLGLGSRGLPMGVQVVANAGNDHLSIAVAEILETELGGWVPPWQKDS